MDNNPILDYLLMAISSAAGALTSVLQQKKDGTNLLHRVGQFFICFCFGFIAGAWATGMLGLSTANNYLAAYLGALVALAAIPKIMTFGSRIFGGEDKK